MDQSTSGVDSGFQNGLANSGEAGANEPTPSNGLEDVNNEEQSPDDLQSSGSGPKAPSIDNAATQENLTKSELMDNTDKRVYVHNVLKFLNPRHVEKMTNGWLEALQKDHPSILFEKVKKPPKDNWVQVTVNSEEFVQPLLDYINGSNLLNKKGGTMYATRPNSKRRRSDGDDNGDPTSRKRQHLDKDTVQQPKDPRDVVTPLWRQSYQEQLKSKLSEMIFKSAAKIVKEVKSRFQAIQREAKRNPNFRKAVKEYAWLRRPRPIEVSDILPAPALHRNKCEFTFGYRCKTESQESDGGKEAEQVPAVGFLARGWAGKVTSPHIFQPIPDEACAVVDIVDDFLSDSPIPPYDSKVHRGLWRYLTVRTSRRTGECMVIICHAPSKGGAGAKDDSDDYSDTFPSEKERLVSMLTADNLVLKFPRVFEKDETFTETTSNHLEDLPVRVTSVFFQEYDGLSNPKPDHPVQVSLHNWVFPLSNRIIHLTTDRTLCDLACFRETRITRKARKMCISDISGRIFPGQYSWC